jgi:hypothetical protein
MTEYNTFDVLCPGDSGEYAKKIWTAVEKRADDTEEIRTDGEFTSADTWDRFCWKQLSRVEMQPFEADRATDRKPVPDVPHVEIRYDPEPFHQAIESRDETDLAETAVDLLELVEYAYAGGPKRPRFVYGVSEPHRKRLVENEIRPPVTPESLSEDRIEYAAWLMGFPPSMVEHYGRETLLSAPAWQTSELPDGGIVVLTTEDPTNVSKPETRAIDQRLDVDPPPATEQCRY